jgi:uracil-DNA glycosylase
VWQDGGCGLEHQRSSYNLRVRPQYPVDAKRLESLAVIFMEQFDLFGSTESPKPSTPEVNLERIPLDAKVPIPSGIYPDLETLTRHCNECQRCELSQNRTYAVVSRGNPKAKLLIIGEAPGANEDQTGLPYVGKSGMLLDKILESVQFDPKKDVYICNVLKCRPPENRDPSTKEIELCSGYLFEQIRLVDPKVILLTGKYAMQVILKEKRGITKVRGTWQEWEGRWVMPVFHPAYLLRNQSREAGSPKWLMWQDIQEVRKKYLELTAQEI